MQDQTPQSNWIASFWQRNRLVFKGFLIGFIALLLLIPTAFIDGLIAERQGRQREAIEEVSSKWAGAQTVAGPVIGIPFVQNKPDGKGHIEAVRDIAYFLPETLDIKGSISPEERHRGIYKVIVYNSVLGATGKFGRLDISSLGIDTSSFLLKEAFVLLSVDDIRGIKEEVRLTLGDKSYELVPGTLPDNSFANVMMARIDMDNIIQPRSFAVALNIRGSESLSFQPLGKRTHVNLQSSWTNPRFSGNYLPDNRSLKETGFNATWNLLYMNRKFPQQWTGKNNDIKSADFGVDLLVPVDSYLKSQRSVKYAILCIVLTFTAFFLIELVYAKTVHPFQYILVGFALCMFYTLLISISEYLQFNTAYLIASVATVSMVTVFVRSVFHSATLSSFIGITLAIIYGFIYVLIQSQDYALLMGSIGLFCTLGLVMFFSAKAKLP